MIGKLKSLIRDKVFKSLYRPGHYYSPVPDSDYIERNAEKIFIEVDTIAGLELNAAYQLELAKNFENFYSQMPFSAEMSSDNRYYFNNNFFIKADGLALYNVLRHFKPKKIIEVGSGFSSALMLDVKDKFLVDLELIFIEPFPERLYSLFKDYDKEKCKVIQDFVQNIELSVYDTLGESDLLFIDSSHVSKVGSDVNHLFFNVLPKLKPGVIIHFHDICFPFEYPKEWILRGIHWNEAYLLKAFLMYNDSFEIIWFNNYLHHAHNEALKNELTYYNHSGAGGSLYLRKVK